MTQRLVRCPAAVLGVFLGCVTAPACGGAAAPSPSARVAVALASSAGTLSVKSVTWAVLAGNGEVLSSGTTDAGDPDALLSVLVTVPAGTNERISVIATLENGVSCKGISNPLDVLSGQQIAVNVSVACDASGSGQALGSVLISTDLTPGDHCPALDGWSATVAPGAVATTGQVYFSVSASDGDAADHLGYSWSATNGSFSDTVTPTTSYFCQQTGAQSVTVTIADDHQPQACVSSVRFPPFLCP